MPVHVALLLLSDTPQSCVSFWKKSSLLKITHAFYFYQLHPGHTLPSPPWSSSLLSWVFSLPPQGSSFFLYFPFFSTKIPISRDCLTFQRMSHQHHTFSISGRKLSDGEVYEAVRKRREWFFWTVSSPWATWVASAQNWILKLEFDSGKAQSFHCLIFQRSSDSDDGCLAASSKRACGQRLQWHLAWLHEATLGGGVRWGFHGSNSSESSIITSWLWYFGFCFLIE